MVAKRNQRYIITRLSPPRQRMQISNLYPVARGVQSFGFWELVDAFCIDEPGVFVAYKQLRRLHPFRKVRIG